MCDQYFREQELLNQIKRVTLNKIANVVIFNNCWVNLKDLVNLPQINRQSP